MPRKLDRRALFIGGARVASAGILAQLGNGANDTLSAVVPALDSFIGRYMRAMDAPGMTLSLATAGGAAAARTYGYADLDSKSPVTPEHLFEIGSISKSFVALTLLQLRDEGKVELHRPVLEYLPWLPVEANYGTITVHHLLTHTSGLPNSLGLFLSDPAARHVQAFKPGERFHYCNLGYAILGHLIEKLDGRPFPESIRERMFRPLGMSSSEAVIAGHNRARTSRSYVPLFDDIGFAPHDPLTPAGNLVFDDAAGSILSTPGDMGRYLQMLLRKGQLPNGRLMPETTFADFAKPYIEAKELSPTASYGYGIGVDKLDGRTILRHTGGMISFASAMHVDLDSGAAAFASVNVQLGYRPNPVTEYAVRLVRAHLEGNDAPKVPDLPDRMAVKNAGDYAGSYTSPDGRGLEVLAAHGGLAIRTGEETIQLQAAGVDTFWAMERDLRRFPFQFGRAEGSKVVELAHGSDWYTNAGYTGPRTFPAARGSEPFAGHYRGDSAWTGSIRVVLRKGQLWLGGDPLVPIGKALFRIGPAGPDTIEFLHVVDGKARMMKYAGADLWRVEAI